MVKRAIPVAVRDLECLLESVSQTAGLAVFTSVEDALAFCYPAARVLFNGARNLDYWLSVAVRLAATLHLSTFGQTVVNRRALVVASALEHRLFQPFDAAWFRCVETTTTMTYQGCQAPEIARAGEIGITRARDLIEFDWSAGYSHFISRDYITVFALTDQLPIEYVRVVESCADSNLRRSYLLRSENFVVRAPHRVRPKRLAHRAAVIADLSEFARTSEMDIVRAGTTTPFHGRQDIFVKLR